MAWRKSDDELYQNYVILGIYNFSTGNVVGPGIGSSGIDVGPSIRSSGVDIGPGKQSLGRVGLDTKSLGRRSFQLAEAAAQARRAWVEVGLDVESLGRPVLRPAGWSGLGKKSRGRMSGTCRC